MNIMRTNGTLEMPKMITLIVGSDIKSSNISIEEVYHTRWHPSWGWFRYLCECSYFLLLAWYAALLKIFRLLLIRQPHIPPLAIRSRFCWILRDSCSLLLLPSHTLLLQVLLYLSRHPGIPTSMTRGICSSACKMSVRLYLAIARVCQAAGTCSARDHMERTAVCPRSSTAYPNDELRRPNDFQEHLDYPNDELRKYR